MARALGERIAARPTRIAGAVTLNIVCFRYAAGLEDAASDRAQRQDRESTCKNAASRPIHDAHKRETRIRLNVMNHRTQRPISDATLDASSPPERVC